MGLLKTARGLPKFVMECGWWRHPSWVGARAEAIAVQMAAVSYCTEHETDGRLPGPGTETVATALGLDARLVKRGVEELLDRGRWVEHDDGYEVVGYLEHNASRAEIREHRDRRSAAGRKGNEVRWGSHSGRQGRSDSDTDGIAPGNPRGEERRGEKKPRTGRGATGPPDPFPIDDELRAQMAAECPGVSIDLEARKLVDWARSKGIRRKDWRAALRNWVRKAHGDATRSNGSNGNGRDPAHVVPPVRDRCSSCGRLELDCVCDSPVVAR